MSLAKARLTKPNHKLVEMLRFYNLSINFGMLLVGRFLLSLAQFCQNPEIALRSDIPRHVATILGNRKKRNVLHVTEATLDLTKHSNYLKSHEFPPARTATPQQLA